jgi:hypothetical protein|tara:strand:- start:2521 stop:3192 length:672 start_codon:yes stop_codon:yes gene_type:complete
MKLNNKTIDILRNFGMIQPNLVVESGSTISTLAEAKHIMAEAQIDETFDSGFGIYDLNEFLSAHSLLEGPELDFAESHVILKSGNAKVKYHFADTEILTKKTQAIQMPPADLSFTFTEANINNIRKAASSLNLDSPTLSLIVEDGNIVARVLCTQNPSSNSYSLVIGKYDGDDTEADYRFNIDNLKLISGDYSVDITNKLISNWKHETVSVQYWIALDKTSTV